MDIIEHAEPRNALGRALRLARIALAFGRVERITRHEDGVRPETDTDHTVMLGLVACELAPADLDRARVAAFALVHDLAEVYAGDTPTLAISPEAMVAKDAREAAARARVAAELGDGSWVAALLAAYEQQREPEARFVRLIDKVLPKLTHAFNECVAARSITDRSGFVAAHDQQLRKLRASYPEFADGLDLLRASMLHSEACWPAAATPDRRAAANVHDHDLRALTAARDVLERVVKSECLDVYGLGGQGEANAAYRLVRETLATRAVAAPTDPREADIETMSYMLKRVHDALDEAHAIGAGGTFDAAVRRLVKERDEARALLAQALRDGLAECASLREFLDTTDGIAQAEAAAVARLRPTHTHECNSRYVHGDGTWCICGTGDDPAALPTVVDMGQRIAALGRENVALRARLERVRRTIDQGNEDDAHRDE